MKSKKVIVAIFVILSFFVLSNASGQETKTDVNRSENTAENVDTTTIIKNIATEIKDEISYCVVQIAALTTKKSKRQIKKENEFYEYPIKIKKEEGLFKVLIKKKFYNKGGENLFDSNNRVLRNAVRVQMKCKKQYKFYDSFIAVYNKSGKRVAIIKDVPHMKYIIL